MIDFIFIGMFLFLRRLLFADRVKLVGNLILISAGILLTVSVSSEGTILAPATALFSMLVIMSGFIFNLQGIIAATIISSLLVACLILAHQAGILPPPNYTESTFQWFAFTSTFGLTGWLVYFYNQLTDQALERSRMEIRERERAEEKLRQQNEYLSILHQITLDLLNRHSVNELLQVIVDRSVILLDAPFSELMLEKDGELVVQTFTQNQDSLKGDRVGRAEAKLSWSAFKTKMPAVLDDYSTYPDRREIYSEHTLHAVADFPVLIRGKSVGVLAMGRSQAEYVFSETQIKNGVLFAQLVALVLDNAQLFSDAEHEISERKQAEDALQKANEQLRVDMEKIEQLKEELHEQAIHDPLTGLYNRRYLNKTLASEITRVERENNSLSVIMLDIDHFKMINDTYGHPVGDKFLVEIASLMKKHTRDSDIVCRYGGEEFLLVFPGTALASAARRAEEIRQVCTEIIIQHEGKDLNVTISVGVATYPTHGKEAEEIIIKADKALYQSKQSGRNRVTAWVDEKIN